VNSLDHKHYITRKALRVRYGGISEMTLWRWERDDKLGFPNALEINGRKYYDLSQIERFERTQADFAARKRMA
jgi:hypothetical protein